MKELWEYVYPETPPEGYTWSKEQEWTCPIHDNPVNDYDYYACDKECCVVCRLCDDATWRWTGEWKLSANLHGLNKIMLQYYLPKIKEQLNQTSFLTLLQKEINAVRGDMLEFSKHPTRRQGNQEGVSS
jgi:hypothetical protein